jgi:uncharacterized protein YidB (DUF937 family)
MSLDQLKTVLILLAVGELCVAAAIAVIYYIGQARLMRQMTGVVASLAREQRAFQEALNRPILSVNMSCSDSSAGNAPYLRVHVENCGNGPANLRAVQLLIDGRMIALTDAGDHEKAALRLLEKQFTRNAGGYISIGDHWVGSGKSSPIFTMDLDPSVKRKTLDTLARRLNIKVDYGSTFDDGPVRSAWMRAPTG